MNFLLYSYLIYCSYTDIKKREVNAFLSLVFILLSLILLVICNYLPDFFPPLTSHDSIMSLFLGMIPGIFLLCLSPLTGRSIECGDGIMVIVIGSFLSLTASFTIVFISLFLCAVFSICCAVTTIIHKLTKALKPPRVFLIVNRKTTIPFAPFLLLGYSVFLLLEAIH